MSNFASNTILLEFRNQICVWILVRLFYLFHCCRWTPVGHGLIALVMAYPAFYTYRMDSNVNRIYVPSTSYVFVSVLV